MKQLPITLYVSDEYNFIAQDYNGSWWAYEKEPYMNEEINGWDIEANYKPLKVTEVREDMNIVSWRETLTKI